MSYTITSIEVEDYDRWRAKFDSMEIHRREHGVGGEHVYQDATNPNMVTVIIEGDLSDLQSYSGSQELKEAMAEGGVVGPPRFSFYNEVT